jgi:signal peptidase I
MGERGRPRRKGGADEGQEHRGHRHAAPRDQRRARASEEPRTTLRGPGEGRAARRKAAKRIKRRRRLRATREIPILIGVALLIALILKTFLVQAFVIPSGSMEETIRIDDRVLVDKLTPWFGWEPERGDVVVFNDPGGWLEQDPVAEEEDDDPVVIKQVKGFLTWIGLLPSEDDDLIKRVIGVSGDTVKCCDRQGRVTVNGAPLDEPYLFPGNPPSTVEFEVTVPEGRIFVMGDHRSNSADSRSHMEQPGNGTVPVDLVVGRAVVIAWPFGHWQRLDGEETFSAVPDPASESLDAASVNGRTQTANEIGRLPTPAELPLVMGVVSLLRIPGRPERSVRSGRGGCSGRCTVRRGGTGGTSGAAAGWRDSRRETPWCGRQRCGGRRRGRSRIRARRVRKPRKPRKPQPRRRPARGGR